jgi:hypothetical protein
MSFPLKIGACKAICSFCPNLSKEVLAPYLPTILTGTMALAVGATQDTLHLVLDTVLVAARVDPTITAKYESTITPYLLAIWSKNSNDPLISSAIEVR